MSDDFKPSTAEEIIEDIRQGKMVVIMDDIDRENEGDLIMAAEKVTTEDINFMAQYGRGLICLTLTEARCRQLNLPLMVEKNADRNSTNFTVSIEAAEGVTTGISAADRAHTVRVAVSPDVQPSDIVMPGHIFPIMAKPGGVLTRAGHTEAGCDLARLAGLEPAATIVEILNPDGTMARYDDLVEFARRHNLKLGTIADLIRFRVRTEKAIERVSESVFPTRYGDFRLVTYHDLANDDVHLALIMGDIRTDQPTLVRVQVMEILNDVLGLKTSRLWNVDRALAKIASEGKGVLVLMNRYDTPRDIVKQVQQHKMRQMGITSAELEASPVLRFYGVGAQILVNLGVGKMRIMDRPITLHGLAGFGLELVEFVSPDNIGETP